MNLFRGFLLTAAAVLGILAGAAGLASDSHFQTWAVRRSLARRPELGISVGSVSLGLNDALLRNVRIERRGAVLTFPEVRAELPVLPAGFRKTVLIRRLVARGGVLDLSGFADGGLASAAAAVPMGVFQGIFNQLKLPADFGLDGLDLEGDVVLPAAPGRAAGRMHVMMSGGGLAAGQEGRFVFNLRFTPTEAGSPVNSLVGDGTLAAAMDSPRGFRSLALHLDGTAMGPRLAHAVRLSADVGAARGPNGETYSATLAGAGKPLASLQAGFPGGSALLSGTWKLDLSDDDLTPFMLGRALPAFDGVGDGRFETDPALAEIHVRGSLSLTADRLALLRPQLAGVGAVRLAADFDLTRQGSALRVDRLHAALSGTRPILSVIGLQPFGFDAATGELTVSDSAHGLFGVALRDVPLEWAQPFLRGIVLTGSPIRGSFVASAREGGLSLRSDTPLTIANVSATRAGQPLLQNLALSADSSATYTPQGWQVEMKGRVSAGTSVSGDGPAAAPSLLEIEAKWGRILAANAPVKLTGRLRVDLPAALAQPAFAALRHGAAGEAGDGQPALVDGSAVGEFAASLAAARAVEVKLTLSNLAVGVRNQPLLVDAGAEGNYGQDLGFAAERLPDATVDVRADIDPSGRTVFRAPLVLTRDGRRTDLEVDGNFRADPGGMILDGRIAGQNVFLEDAKMLAALGELSPARLRGAGPAAFPAARTSFWNGVTGRLTFSLQNLIAPQFSATGVGGVLRIDPPALTLEGLHAAAGESGDVKAGGRLAFDGSAREAYSLAGSVTVGNFDPAPIFRARYPGRLPTVEGKFDVTGEVSGGGSTPFDAVAASRGEMRFVSAGGLLRLFPADAAARNGSAHRVAIISSLLGDLAGVVTGRKDLGPEIEEVAGKIAAIPYDQMSFVLARDAVRNTVLRDFALISPEIRLEGGGQATWQAETPLLEQPFAAVFKLRARGHTADIFKLVGMLDPHPDDLGYFAFLEPLKVAGTLGKPDTSELQAALMRDVYKNSGASDLFDKLLGK